MSIDGVVSFTEAEPRWRCLWAGGVVGGVATLTVIFHGRMWCGKSQLSQCVCQRRTSHCAITASQSCCVTKSDTV